MVKTTVQTVTPEQAASWLEQSNTRNRTLNKLLVRQIAEDMKCGRYMLNGEAVIFSDAGDIIDGHHRLTACVKSGVSFQTVIVSGVPSEVMPTVDTGDSRSRSHVLQFAGIKNSKVVSAVCKMVWHAERGQLGAYCQNARSVGFTHSTMLDVIERHPGVHDAVTRGETHSRRFPPLAPTPFAFLSYWLPCHDASLGGEFLNKLSDGNGLLANCPVAILRNRLIEDTARKSAKMPPLHKMALVIKAWRFFARGETVRYLKWVENEPFPDTDPLA